MYQIKSEGTSNVLSISEMCKVFDRSKMMNRTKSKWTKPIPSPIDWIKRNKLKYSIFRTHICLLFFLTIVSTIFVIIPIWVAASQELGKALLLSIPPMIMVALSWMIPAWKFFDKRQILLATTLGAIPIHILEVVVFAWMIAKYCSDIPLDVFYIGMMIHWAIFFVPVFSMLSRFGSKLEMTSESDPT